MYGLGLGALKYLLSGLFVGVETPQGDIMIAQAKNQISEGFSSVESQLSDLKERLEQRASNVQVRIRKTQSRGVIRLFRAQEKAASTIHKSADRPPSKLPENLKKELEALGDKLLASPVEDWDSYNAKVAIKASAELGLLDLLRVRRYESATKNRKTVLAALDKRIAKHEDGAV